MTLAGAKESMEDLLALLRTLRLKGARIWSERGIVRYTAPKGVLTRDDVARLRACRAAIASLLAESTGVDESNKHRDQMSLKMPLGFSQQWHWEMFNLGTKQALRSVASATRLQGGLDISVLKEAISRVVIRHDALRTRIVEGHGTITQELHNSPGFEVAVDDVTKCQDACRQDTVVQIIENYILEPVDFGRGPLFGARVVKCSSTDTVLILAMDHMISDAFSLSILLRDILGFYAKILFGRVEFIPEISLQYPDYCVWQREQQRRWSEEHSTYWNQRLAGNNELRFPSEGCRQQNACQGWGTVPIQFGRSLKEELRVWCRQKGTTMTMGALTAYAALVLRWCDVPETIIQYQTNGRSDPTRENTVGYFASLLCLRVEIHNNGRLIDLLHGITEEYCHAHQHTDLAYMATQVTSGEFSRNTIFNWVSLGHQIDTADLELANGAIAASEINFTNPVVDRITWENDPEMILFDTKDDIVGNLCFQRARFSSYDMEFFARNFIRFLRSLIENPAVRVSELLLV